MSAVVEQINVICEANFIAVRELATISLDGTENALKVSLQATSKLIDDESGQPNTNWANNSLPNLLTDWSNAFQDNTNKVLETIQTYFESTIKAQSELARLIQDQVANANTSFLDTVGESTKARLALREPEEAPKRQKPRKVTA